jgi:steroid 5-alpha reductase family enzyme
VWATRLGSHLFSRINKDKKDARSACTRDTTLCRTNSPQTAHQHSYRHASLPCPLLCRFDMMRDSGAKLLLPWMTQGLWAFALSLPVTLTNALFAADQSTSTVASALVGSSYSEAAMQQLTLRDMLGWAIWAGAFALEVVADQQKSKFAADEANKGKFIDQGLWRLSRHPNCKIRKRRTTQHNFPTSSTTAAQLSSFSRLCCCFVLLLSDLGEMTMWFGLFLSCSSAFTARSHYLSIAGPCFNAFLLLFVSGIPLLEASSDKKFGKQSAYQQYKQRTPVLIPKLSALVGLFNKQAKPSSAGKQSEGRRGGSALR